MNGAFSKDLHFYILKAEGMKHLGIIDILPHACKDIAAGLDNVGLQVYDWQATCILSQAPCSRAIWSENRELVFMKASIWRLFRMF